MLTFNPLIIHNLLYFTKRTTVIYLHNTMRKDKGSAFEMRRLGKSYQEIQRALNISKSTLSEWFQVLEWSENIKSALL